ncbi:uncharacterized protein LOC141907285 [Tubulanus polymorphus]|uniref:uncharacterized protein LOC141907285 n=1 Tax=Tubulanus polymorphus TaxID=672921 RepID=UPI003DA231C2
MSDTTEAEIDVCNIGPDDSSSLVDTPAPLKTRFVLPENVPVLKCPHCPYQDRLPYSFERHLKFHNPPTKRLHCSHCKYSTNRKSEILKHMEEHERFLAGEKLACPDCDFETDKITSYKLHRTLKHSPRLVKCPNCAFTTDSDQIMKLHVYQHYSAVESYKCEVCNARFLYRSWLSRHVKCHNPSIHRCKRCSFVTSERAQLDAHAASYDGVIYLCELCEFKGCSRDDVVSHMKEVHIPCEEKSSTDQSKRADQASKLSHLFENKSHEQQTLIPNLENDTAAAETEKRGQRMLHEEIVKAFVGEKWNDRMNKPFSRLSENYYMDESSRVSVPEVTVNKEKSSITLPFKVGTFSSLVFPINYNCQSDHNISASNKLPKKRYNHNNDNDYINDNNKKKTDGVRPRRCRLEGTNSCKSKLPKVSRAARKKSDPIISAKQAQVCASGIAQSDQLKASAANAGSNSKLNQRATIASSRPVINCAMNQSVSSSPNVSTSQPSNVPFVANPQMPMIYVPASMSGKLPVYPMGQPCQSGTLPTNNQVMTLLCLPSNSQTVSSQTAYALPSHGMTTMPLFQIPSIAPPTQVLGRGLVPIPVMRFPISQGNQQRTQTPFQQIVFPPLVPVLRETNVKHPIIESRLDSNRKASDVAPLNLTAVDRNKTKPLPHNRTKSVMVIYPPQVSKKRTSKRKAMLKTAAGASENIFTDSEELNLSLKRKDSPHTTETGVKKRRTRKSTDKIRAGTSQCGKTVLKTNTSKTGVKKRRTRKPTDRICVGISQCEKFPINTCGDDRADANDELENKDGDGDGDVKTNTTREKVAGANRIQIKAAAPVISSVMTVNADVNRTHAGNSDVTKILKSLLIQTKKENSGTSSNSAENARENMNHLGSTWEMRSCAVEVTGRN